MLDVQTLAHFSGGDAPARRLVGLKEAARLFFVNYANFEGRSSRGAFWHAIFSPGGLRSPPAGSTASPANRQSNSRSSTPCGSRLSSPGSRFQFAACMTSVAAAGSSSAWALESASCCSSIGRAWRERAGATGSARMSRRGSAASGRRRPFPRMSRAIAAARRFASAGLAR